MILTCPSCESKYLVDVKQIGNGRHVKCTRCNHTWYYENNNFDIKELEIQKEPQSTKAKEDKTNLQSNLPVVYENKTTVPLPFLLLVVVAVSLLGYMIFESIEFDSEALKKYMNQSIDKIVIWFKNFIETLLRT
tara:strand:- start:504 stop:905 length:402 start_codon:yes stop_codon:yes gene_type:complete